MRHKETSLFDSFYYVVLTTFPLKDDKLVLKRLLNDFPVINFALLNPTAIK